MGTEALSVTLIIIISTQYESQSPDLDLPLSLRSRQVCTQAVYIEVHRCEIGVDIAETAGLSRAASYGMGMLAWRSGLGGAKLNISLRVSALGTRKRTTPFSDARSAI